MLSLDNTSSWVVSVMRGGRGLVANPAPRQPEQTLEVYEYESCPYCRKVREVLTEMDLNYISIPTAKGSKHRERLNALGGRSMVPYLVDPNTGESMYESEDIITYLKATYGSGRSTASRVASPFNTISSTVASATRPLGLFTRAKGGKSPDERLILYNFEASPYCRKVREALCKLDIPYEVRNVAKRSARRPELVELGGKMMVPYLIDPNTDTAMYESNDIVAYLEKTYGC